MVLYILDHQPQMRCVMHTSYLAFVRSLLFVASPCCVASGISDGETTGDGSQDPATHAAAVAQLQQQANVHAGLQQYGAMGDWSGTP
jgi:hypothetical protein